MVRKVVIPATISVLILCLAESKPKTFRNDIVVILLSYTESEVPLGTKARIANESLISEVV